MTATQRGYPVRLTSFEVFVAAMAGVKRRLDAIRKAKSDRYGIPSQDPRILWGMDIESCCGEAAVAKMLGRWWLGSALSDSTTGIGDAGRGVETRSTSKQHGCLMVHPPDPDDSLFYLAIGQTATWRILGPILGSDAKQQQWWKNGDGRPAFFVPQDELPDPVVVSL